jgi:hypothetical protein
LLAAALAPTSTPASFIREASSCEEDASSPAAAARPAAERLGATGRPAVALSSATTRERIWTASVVALAAAPGAAPVCARVPAAAAAAEEEADADTDTRGGARVPALPSVMARAASALRVLAEVRCVGVEAEVDSEGIFRGAVVTLTPAAVAELVFALELLLNSFNDPLPDVRSRAWIFADVADVAAVLEARADLGGGRG